MSTSSPVDYQQFIKANVTKSRWLMAWIAFLLLAILIILRIQFSSSISRTLLLLLVWGASVAWMVVAEVQKKHSKQTLWLKDNLYSTLSNCLITLLLFLILIPTFLAMYGWAVQDATFTADAVAVKASEKTGASWGSVIDNFGLLMRYRLTPANGVASWRLYGMVVYLLVTIAMTWYGFKQQVGSMSRKIMKILWLLSPVATWLFLRGFGTGLFQTIDMENTWGGFVLSLFLAVFSIVCSFPLGVLLALGRRSQLRGLPNWLIYPIVAVILVLGLLFSTPKILGSSQNIIQTIVAFWPIILALIILGYQRALKGNVVAGFCITYIELVRGVPLISVLVMSIVILPLILPDGFTLNNVLMVAVGFTLFAAAYLAENIRGGLQAISNGQYEAADSLGLNPFQKYRFIILPQAIRAVVPAIAGQFINLYKDTSLVLVVALFDILNIANTIIPNQQAWQGKKLEPLLFVGFVYYIGCALISWYSQKIEKQSKAFGH